MTRRRCLARQVQLTGSRGAGLARDSAHSLRFYTKTPLLTQNISITLGSVYLLGEGEDLTFTTPLPYLRSSAHEVVYLIISYR